MAATFDVGPQRMEVLFDTASQQQVLALNFVLKVSIPRILQEIIVYNNSKDQDQLSAFSGLPQSILQSEPQKVATSREGPGSFRVREGSAPGRLQGSMTSSAKVSGLEFLQRPVNVRDVSEGPPGLVPPRQSASAFSEPLQGMPRSGIPSVPSYPDLPAAFAASVSDPHDGPRPRKSASEYLLAAAMMGDTKAVREALKHGADVNEQVLRGGKSVLHCVLDRAGPNHVDVVQCLLKSTGNVNVFNAEQMTPLHMAIANHAQLSPMVERLLMLAHADLSLKDSNGKTPMLQAKFLAQSEITNSNPNSGDTSVDSKDIRVRQLIESINERSTVAIQCLQGEEVLGVKFANTNGTLAAFYTEGSIGFYNVESGCVSAKQKLGQNRAQSVVRAMAVNPELGTLAVFVEATIQQNPGIVSGTVQNLIILWRTGKLQEEESLKLNVCCSPVDGSLMKPTVCLSTVKGPLVVVGRACDGRVLAWHLNSAGVQITTESLLVKRGGGLMAVSGNAHWVAVADHSIPGGVDAVRVFLFEGADFREPRCLPLLRRRPACMAIIENGASGDRPSCLLALQQRELPGQPRGPIEVLSVKADGSMSVVYRLQQGCQQMCDSLSFCHMAPEILMSRWQDGTVRVMDLQSQTCRVAHDDVGANSMAISCKQEMLVTTVGHCFRFHRLPDAVELNCGSAEM